jgi:hypothetical protein
MIRIASNPPIHQHLITNADNAFPSRSSDIPTAHRIRMRPQTYLFRPCLRFHLEPSRTDPNFAIVHIHPGKAIFDQLLVHIHFAHKDESHSASVAIDILLTTRTCFPNTRPAVNCFALYPKSCLRSGQSIPYNRILYRVWFSRTLIVSPSVMPTTFPMISLSAWTVVARARVRMSRIMRRRAGLSMGLVPGSGEK